MKLSKKINSKERSYLLTIEYNEATESVNYMVLTRKDLSASVLIASKIENENPRIDHSTTLPPSLPIAIEQNSITQHCLEFFAQENYTFSELKDNGFQQVAF